MFRKYQVVDNFFDNIDCEIKAYLLGFFVADGYFNLGARCTKSYRFQVTLQDIDKEIVELFRLFICPDATIDKMHYTDGAKNRKPVYSIRWTSSHMANILINKYRIVPNKTKDLTFEFPFETIPNEFLWDFIRGFFDGDGQISYSEITHCSTFALYATSKPWANQLGDLFEKEFGVEKRIEGIKKSTMILYTIRFFSHFHKKEFLLNVYRKFYHNRNFYMHRKEEKLRKYLMFKYRANQEDFERLLGSVERS